MSYHIINACILYNHFFEYLVNIDAKEKQLEYIFGAHNLVELSVEWESDATVITWLCIQPLQFISSKQLENAVMVSAVCWINNSIISEQQLCLK